MNTVLLDYNIQIFFLVFARVMALIELTPVVSNAGMNMTSRAGLAFFTSFVITPIVIAGGYILPKTGFEYALMLIIEALIGLTMGFFVYMIFAIAHSSGQLFSMQMGFGATEAYDPITGVEIPIMGQFLNLAAIMIFFLTNGMQKLFIMGLEGSFRHIKASNFTIQNDDFITFMVQSLTFLFGHSLLVAMPLIASLFLVSVMMGLLGKASPQMNLMMIGFPIQIAIAFVILLIALPNMFSAFDAMFETMWTKFSVLWEAMS